MTNLLDMNNRMNQWMAEKPAFEGGAELKLYDGDTALVQFVATGADGDAFIKVYKSHVFPQMSSKGTRFNAYRYCTLQNEGTECVFCSQGHTDVKERMSMWFYVFNILHNNAPRNKPNLVQATYEGRIVYNEEVNGFKRWDDSAWRESPWADIIQLFSMYGSLHNFVATLKCTGQGMQKRYKVYPIPNSAFLDPTTYQRAQQECTPILQTLRAQQQQAVQINPQQQQTVQLPAGGFASVAAFSTPGTPTPPPLALPSVVAAPAPAPAFAPPPPMMAAPAPMVQTPAPPQPLPAPQVMAAAPPPAAVAVHPDLGLPAPPAAVVMAPPAPVTPVQPLATPVAPQAAPVATPPVATAPPAPAPAAIEEGTEAPARRMF